MIPMPPIFKFRVPAKSHNLPQFCLADYSFHQEVYLLSSNSFLIQACQAIAAAPFAYILCDCLAALPTDYLSLAEDHREMIAALQEGPEIAARVTRERIEIWRSHSLEVLGPLERAALG